MILIIITTLFNYTSAQSEKDLKLKENLNKCFSGDCKNGKGVFINYYDTYYSGKFKNGKYHGNGTVYKNDKVVFTGEYKNGKKDGKGKLTSGHLIYEGDYKDDKYEGYGKFEDTLYKISYTGSFKKGKYHGKGEITTRDGTKYTGEFRNGSYHGKGLMIKPDGSKLDGDWKEGKFAEKELKNAWVKAASGLRMRSKSATDSEIIIVIPDRSEVRIHEEIGDVLTISGASGRWTRVEYDGKSGWVFGGFLSAESPGNDEIIARLNNFPAEWTRVNEIGGTYYVLKPCFAQISVITIHPAGFQSNEGPVLIWGWGQDTGIYKILNFSTTGNGGVFTIKNGKNLYINVKYDSDRKKAIWKLSDGSHEYYYIHGNFLNGGGTKDFPYKIENEGNCGQP